MTPNEIAVLITVASVTALVVFTACAFLDFIQE
jgi:hypothetical protein